MPYSRRRDNAAMTIYYAGIVGTGVFSISDEPSPAIADAIGVGPAMWAYGISLIAAGISGMVARHLRRRDVEVTALRWMAALTLCHAALVIAADGGAMTGLRLLVAPLMMWVFSDLLQGYHISRDDVRRLSRQVDQ